MRSAWRIAQVTDPGEIPQQLCDLVLGEAEITQEAVGMHQYLAIAPTQGVSMLNQDKAVPLDSSKRLMAQGILDTSTLSLPARSRPRSGIH